MNLGVVAACLWVGCASLRFYFFVSLFSLPPSANLGVDQSALESSVGFTWMHSPVI